MNSPWLHRIFSDMSAALIKKGWPDAFATAERNWPEAFAGWKQQPTEQT